MVSVLINYKYFSLKLLHTSLHFFPTIILLLYIDARDIFRGGGLDEAIALDDFFF